MFIKIKSEIGGEMKKSLSANTCVYPTPVWVVGTYGEEDQPNVMTAAWGGVCCSKPPCVAVSLREATLSHGNIIRSKAFTINIGTEKFATEVDYFGISTGRNVDKFAATGLTPQRSTCVNAPFIAEFPLVLECRLMKIVEIGLHTQFIGEIVDVKAEESILDEKDMVDIDQLKPLVFSPVIRKYHGIGSLVGDAFSMGKSIRKK